MEAFQQEGGNELSRKIYDKLMNNDRKLLELLIGHPRTGDLPYKIEIHPPT